MYGNRWWQIRLLSFTEEHGDGKRLTRVRLQPYPTTFSGLTNLAFGVVSLTSAAHVNFRDIGNFLPKRSVLVLNETKVIPARLHLKRSSSAPKSSMILVR